MWVLRLGSKIRGVERKRTFCSVFLFMKLQNTVHQVFKHWCVFDFGSLRHYSKLDFFSFIQKYILPTYVLMLGVCVLWQNAMLSQHHNICSFVAAQFIIWTFFLRGTKRLSWLLNLILLNHYLSFSSCISKRVILGTLLWKRLFNSISISTSYMRPSESILQRCNTP